MMSHGEGRHLVSVLYLNGNLFDMADFLYTFNLFPQKTR